MRTSAPTAASFLAFFGSLTNRRPSLRKTYRVVEFFLGNKYQCFSNNFFSVQLKLKYYTQQKNKNTW